MIRWRRTTRLREEQVWAAKITIEQVEAMALQLPPADQLRLAARICNLLSAAPAMANGGAVTDPPAKPASANDIQDYIVRCDEVAALWQGPIDAVEDLRRIREDED